MTTTDRFARCDDLLMVHAEALGADFTGYRNHVHRVAELCADLAPDPSAREIRMIGVAAVFHDLGIWTDRTSTTSNPRSAAPRRISRGRVSRTGRPKSRR